jgi:uncharacterized protein (DUF983 family)
VAERKFEVKPVGVDYICDDCGAGTMVQTGMMLLSNPGQYKHRCSHCGKEVGFFTKYPDIRYERVEAE